MKIKTDPRDVLFSKLVRTRARWRCEHCGTQYQDGDRGLQCAHIVGRRNKAVRWHPLNAIALCYSCHMHFTANPLEFIEWLRTPANPARCTFDEFMHGRIDLPALRERARPIMKLSTADKKEILDNLKAAWKAMKPGKDFPSPYPCDSTDLERRERAAREAA